MLKNLTRKRVLRLVDWNVDAGRQYLRPKHLSTTGIVIVDHAITNFINSKLSKLHKLKKIGTFTSTVIFPDYKDILDCVERCNTLNNLGLDTKQQQRIGKLLLSHDVQQVIRDFDRSHLKSLCILPISSSYQPEFVLDFVQLILPFHA